MPFAPPMSKESEQRLLSCLDRIAAIQREEPDSDVNQVLTKAATELRVPAGHIPLLVNAYVTGKSAQARVENSNVWDKAASFPIPDAQVIRSAMFPVEVVKESNISEDYQKPPEILFRHRDRVLEKEKLVAQVKEAAFQKTTPAAIPAEEVELKSQSLRWQHAKIAAEEARRRSNMALDLINSTFDELLDSVKSANGVQRFDELEQNLVATRGDSGLEIVDLLRSAVSPETIKRLNKSGASLSPATGKIYELADLLLEAKKIFRTLVDDFAVKEAEERRLFSERYPLPEGKQSPAFIRGVPVETEEEKRAAMDWTSLMSEAATAPLAEMIAPVSDMAKARSNVATANMLYKPKPDFKYRALLDNINRESFVYDLLHDNSGHDPREVLRAYKELSGLAPKASTQEAIMKDFVRKRLEGGPLSYFDLEALTRIEKNLKQIHEGAKMSDGDN